MMKKPLYSKSVFTIYWGKFKNYFDRFDIFITKKFIALGDHVVESATSVKKIKTFLDYPENFLRFLFNLFKIKYQVFEHILLTPLGNRLAKILSSVSFIMQTVFAASSFMYRLSNCIKHSFGVGKLCRCNKRWTWVKVDPEVVVLSVIKFIPIFLLGWYVSDSDIFNTLLNIEPLRVKEQELPQVFDSWNSAWKENNDKFINDLKGRIRDSLSKINAVPIETRVPKELTNSKEFIKEPTENQTSFNVWLATGLFVTFTVILFGNSNMMDWFRF